MPIYLKLNTVTGESKAKGHVGWIELTSVSLSSKPPAPSSPGADVENEISDLSCTCTKNVDSTSATLMRLSLSGKPQPGTIDFVDATGRIYLQMQLENVLISSYQLSARGTESVTLNFKQMTISRFSALVPEEAGTLLQQVLSAP